MKKLLLSLVLVAGCEVQGQPFGGGEPIATGGVMAAVAVAGGTGGVAPSVATGGAETGGAGMPGTGGGAQAVGGAGGAEAGGAPVTALGTGGAGGSVSASSDVAAWPVCPDYVTEFESPISGSPQCGVSADGHLLFGCIGVEIEGYPTDTTPCQFTDPNDEYNNSHVFGCVDVAGC